MWLDLTEWGGCASFSSAALAWIREGKQALFFNTGLQVKLGEGQKHKRNTICFTEGQSCVRNNKSEGNHGGEIVNMKLKMYNG